MYRRLIDTGRQTQGATSRDNISTPANNDAYVDDVNVCSVKFTLTKLHFYAAICKCVSGSFCRAEELQTTNVDRIRHE